MATVPHPENGAQAPPSTCVAEASWDDVAAGTLPATSHTQRWHAAVRAAGLVIANHPDFVPEAGRFRAALALARDNMVTLGSEETASVKSGAKTYTVHPTEGCPCQDAQHHSRYCKHYLATLITKEAFCQLTPATPSSTLNGKAPTMETVETIDPHPTPLLAQASDYAPSTLCIKQRIGKRELSWTLRGAHDAVAKDATRIFKYLDQLAERWDDTSVEVPEAPAERPTETATCRYHGTQNMRSSKFGEGKFVCSVKLADGGYCNQTWPAKAKSH